MANILNYHVVILNLLNIVICPVWLLSGYNELTIIVIPS